MLFRFTILDVEGVGEISYEDVTAEVDMGAAGDSDDSDDSDDSESFGVFGNE
jgi:hypothetical protein